MRSPDEQCRREPIRPVSKRPGLVHAVSGACSAGAGVCSWSGRFMLVLLWLTASLPAVHADEASSAGSSDDKSEAAEPPVDPRVEWRKERPISQWRYRTQLRIGFQPSPLFDSVRRHRLRQQLLDVIDRSWGQLCELDVVEETEVFPRSAVGLERLEAEPLVLQFPESDYDKILFVTFDTDGARFRAAVCEFDTRLRELSAVHQRRTTDIRVLAELAFDGIDSAFRPILIVKSIDGLSVGLQVQGGEFPAPDPTRAQIKPGDVLLAVLRYQDKSRTVQQIQTLPSTYVVVESVERSLVQGTLASMLPVSITTKGRRRVEQLCVRVRPQYEQSRVRFVLRANPDFKLIGNRVRVYAKVRANDKTEEEADHYLTDRLGSIVLPVDPEHSLFWLYVDSGDQLVIRVPYAPGLVADSTLQLLDDSIRLGVEGELDLLEGRFIDLIARQAVYKAYALKQAQAGDRKGAEKALAELQKLPGREEFMGALTQIRVQATDEAKATRNRLAESRVRRICDKLEQILERYLNLQRLQGFKDKIEEELQNASATKAAGGT